MMHPRALLFIAAALAGCSESNTGPATGATTLVFTAIPDTLFALGDTANLGAVVRDAGGSVLLDAPIAYLSSDERVAVVTGDGAVVAMGNGVAIVTGSSGSATAEAMVRVRQKLAEVSMRPVAPRVGIGRTTALVAIPVDARGNGIVGLPAPTFSSSEPARVAVGGDGVLGGIEPGLSTITATIQSPSDGARSGTVRVDAVTVQSAATVSMGATTFAPVEVDVERGGLVTFVNDSGVPHDVDFGTPGLDIPVHFSGQHDRTFTDAGAYPYHCNLHAGMTGTVFVH